MGSEFTCMPSLFWTCGNVIYMAVAHGRGDVCISWCMESKRKHGRGGVLQKPASNDLKVPVLPNSATDWKPSLQQVGFGGTFNTTLSKHSSFSTRQTRELAVFRELAVSWLTGTWSLPLPPSVSKESNAVQEKIKIHCNFINKDPLVKGEVEQSRPTGPQWLWINTREEIPKMALDNGRQKCSFALKKTTCLLIELAFYIQKRVDFKSYPHLMVSVWFLLLW